MLLVYYTGEFIEEKRMNELQISIVHGKSEPGHFHTILNYGPCCVGESILVNQLQQLCKWMIYN